MSTITKFLFETRFDLDAEEEITPFIVEGRDPAIEGPEPEPEPEVVVPTFSEEELAAAKSEAYATGKLDGQREAADNIEAKALATMENIVGQLVEITRIEEVGLETSAQEAVHVAVAVARKMFPLLNEHHAMGEVERVVTLALEKLGEEHAVVIQVNDELQPSIEERMSSLAASAGFNGRATIVGSAEIAVGDCQIQWNKGSATRDSTALWCEIDAIIAHNFGQDSDDIEEQSPEMAPQAAMSAAPTTDTENSLRDETEPDSPQDEGAPDSAQEEIKPDDPSRDGENS